MIREGTSTTVLVRGAAPTRRPADHLILSPDLVSSFDGDRWRHSVTLAGPDLWYRFDRTGVDRAGRVLEREVRRTVPAGIWLRERQWLRSSWPDSAVRRLERACQSAATETGTVFVAWTGAGGDDGPTEGYDRVVDR
ncbi:hypothetical protein [Halegenticoccus soli]|uniref:hypothetical protein n=1 Tax=Halegenticoccus soli TaxID=1985678 RepID=UPI000C6CD4D8|nr:hypothetical protein [Halegenticoccus soli]